MGTEDGDVTAVVAWGCFLFVGVFVFFVYDDDA